MIRNHPRLCLFKLIGLSYKRLLLFAPYCTHSICEIYLIVINFGCCKTTSCSFVGCVSFFLTSTKYLPTCEFHCWTEGAFCRQMTDWLRQIHNFFSSRHFFSFLIRCARVYRFFSLSTFFSVYLINLLVCVRARTNFRQTTLLIIKAEIYHQIKMINIFFSVRDPV